MNIDTWLIFTVILAVGTAFATYIITAIMTYKFIQRHTQEGQKTLERLILAFKTDSPQEALDTLVAHAQYDQMADEDSAAPNIEIEDENNTVKTDNYGSIKVDGRIYDLVDSPDYVKEVLYGQKEL